MPFCQVCGRFCAKVSFHHSYHIHSSCSCSLRRMSSFSFVAIIFKQYAICHKKSSPTLLATSAFAFVLDCVYEINSMSFSIAEVGRLTLTSLMYRQESKKTNYQATFFFSSCPSACAILSYMPVFQRNAPYCTFLPFLLVPPCFARSIPFAFPCCTCSALHYTRL